MITTNTKYCPATTREVARALVEGGHAKSTEVPYDDDDRLAWVLTWLEDAEIERDQGSKIPIIHEILTIAENDGMYGSGDVVVEVENAAEMPVGTFFSKLEELTQSKTKAFAKIKKEHFPVPPELEGDPPALPRDISNVSSKELRQLHSEFNACLARSQWLVAVEEADELAAKQIADHHYALIIKKLSGKVDEETGKPKTVAAIEAEAESDDEVMHWRLQQNDHNIQGRLIKSLRDTYKQNCDRLSREWTMREDERNG